MSTELAVLTADTTVLDRAADPGLFIIAACERAKAWLAEVLDHGQIEQIVEIKSQAEAIRVYTAQKQLGKDAELAAAEVVRRAERGIGLAIRRGQENGEIARQGQGGGAEFPPGANQPRGDRALLVPTAFATSAELSGNGAGIYRMADGVTEQQFDKAINEAKAEENLSRANVVRKIGAVSEMTPEQRRVRIAEMATDGHTSHQIAAKTGITPETVRHIARNHNIDIRADRLIGRHAPKTIDSNRIVRETARSLENEVSVLHLVSFNDLDLTEVEEWVSSLTQSIKALNQFTTKLRKLTQ